MRSIFPAMPLPPILAKRAFLDLLPDAICVVDEHGRFVFVSAACERIFGYTQDEMVGRAMIELVAPEDRARTLQAAADIMAGEHKLNFENSYVRKDGRRVHILWSARWWESDRLRIAVARDITERKRAEATQAALYALSEAAHAASDLPALCAHIRLIIDSLVPANNFFVATVDGDGVLSFPYSLDEHRAAPPHALCSEVVRTGQSQLRIAATPDACGWLAVPLKTEHRTTGALVLKSMPGETGYTDRDMALLHFVSTQVATAIKRMQLLAQLKRMAQFDELTGLPNRALLRDRLDTALSAARREHAYVGLLYLDLDRFKEVNDTLGHATGDLLLQETAQRLKRCVRDADTVARVGGDEFVVLLPGIPQPEDALVVARKIRSALGQPVALGGRHLTVLPSIGIAVYPDHGEDALALLEAADQAMYRAKHSGDDCRWAGTADEY
ncbi:diguanylate cyclase domain-containing protein [Methyloversatilis sp.]|uniref:diguanylate cyclase domain-containing protein n=1 Tax=Methyloversatilis sp. TaxID=2569862 RepID=UPI0027B8D042|nr:diguanylate cyclase [Methyloversatilis sp.]